MLEADSTADRSAIASEFLRPAFRRELTPTWLSTVSALAGQRPLDPDEPLRIVDLRCGTGITAAVIAAAHPAAEIWAGDADPANVERAERLARTAGLRNLTVVENGVGDDWHDAAPPSSVDVALVDDVVSTTDADGRAHLAGLLTPARPSGRADRRRVPHTDRVVGGHPAAVPRAAVVTSGATAGRLAGAGDRGPARAPAGRRRRVRRRSPSRAGPRRAGRLAGG